MFYKTLKELPSEHRPTNKLLEDDEALDRWYDAFQLQMDRKSGNQSNKRSLEEAIPQYSPE
jgi:hypothetical protein